MRSGKILTQTTRQKEIVAERQKPRQTKICTPRDMTGQSDGHEKGRGKCNYPERRPDRQTGNIRRTYIYETTGSKNMKTIRGG